MSDDDDVRLCRLAHAVLQFGGDAATGSLIVTDAMEMHAIADRYGLERAVVMAVAAGADLVCIGHAASDEMVGRLQAALVNAVDDGELAEERLAEAAGRVAEFAAWKGTDAYQPGSF